jgi:small-conductance mechanosensitive channel
MTQIQIIETVIAVTVYMIIKILIHRYIDRIVSNSVSTKRRSKVVKKAINVTVLSIFLIVIFSIFGVDQSELAVFIGSVLTVMGIALFAQWSILANITAGVIIFFNHSAQLDDTITIIDKDYEIEGRISDIGLFFIILKTTNNEQIDIPNSIFLNKMIKKKIDA